MTNTVPLVAAGAALSLLAGCAFTPMGQIVRDATDYNIAVESANNKMLLLNILRAKDRRAMHVTGISQMNGSMTTEFATGSVGFSLGGAKEAKTNFGPGATFSTNPTFTMGVLDSEKFHKGFMTPVSTELVAFLVSEGWRPELLFHLLVEKINVGDRELHNDPTSQKDLLDFQQGVRELFCEEDRERGLKCGLDVEIQTRQIGPNLNLDQTKDIAGLIAIEQAKLTLKSVYEYGEYFKLEGVGESRLKFYSKATKRSGLAAKCTGPSAKIVPARARRVDGTGEDEDSGKGTSPITCTLTLRSPQGVLYYLGEIARAQLDRPEELSCNYAVLARDGTTLIRESAPVCVRVPGECQVPLFRIRRSTKTHTPSPADIEVTYLGEKFIIPADEQIAFPTGSGKKCVSRSMQALALVHLLVSLQRSSDDMPKTQSVNLVGGK